MSNELRWTTEVPKVDGFYWMRHCMDHKVVRVVQVELGVGADIPEVWFTCDEHGNEDGWPLSEVGENHDWAGPIQPPLPLAEPRW